MKRTNEHLKKPLHSEFWHTQEGEFPHCAQCFMDEDTPSYAHIQYSRAAALVVYPSDLNDSSITGHSNTPQQFTL